VLVLIAEENNAMTQHEEETLTDKDRREIDAAPFRVERQGDNELRLSGTLRMSEAAATWRALHRETADLRRRGVIVRRRRNGANKRSLAIDLSGVETIDGGVMALLVALRAELDVCGVGSEIVGAPEQVQPLIQLYQADQPPKRVKKRKPEGFVEQVGNATYALGQELKSVVSFIGEMVIATIGVIRSPRTGHLKEVPSLINRAGADAVPIVLLINFLMGFVMAYQSARQLKLYGANIFVADVVGISVTRELAPLMTAIIVCGRTGAAFAAEIGSMKVSEEIDALRTLGLRPFSWLVIPRVIALLVVVPALTIVGDLVGILGGSVVGFTSLDVGFRGYITETQNAVQLWDVEHGLIKSVAFAFTIALVACQQGFAASGGAEGVGKRTTSTVVTCLFALVVIDALFTMVFRLMGKA
jgi:phospholipid/cholesterol/gamma-HCH transport system permease protein